MSTFIKNKLMFAPNNHHFLIPERMIKFFSWFVVFLFVAFLTVVPAGSVLADLGIHAQKTCAGDRSVGACIDESLGRHGNMLNELDGMVSDMAAMGLFSLGQRGAEGTELELELTDKIAKIKKEHGRAVIVNNATTDEEYDATLAEGDKEKGKKCKNSDMTAYNSLLEEQSSNPNDPLIPGYTWVDTGTGKNQFGNGKCDIFEAEAIDEDGYTITVKVNERKENLCEKICKDKTDNMGKTKGRFIDSMLETSEAADSARQLISLQRQKLTELGGLLYGLRLTESDYPSIMAGDPCAPGTLGPSGELIAEGILQGTIIIADVVIVVSDFVVYVSGYMKDVWKVAANQTIAGFNASTSALPVTNVHQIAKGITYVTKGIKTGLSDAKAVLSIAVKVAKTYKSDKAKACTKLAKDNTDTLLVDTEKLKKDTTILKRTAGETAAALVRVEDELALMKGLLNKTLELLITPQGQREDFPAKK